MESSRKIRVESHLGLWDATSIIVGIIIGVGIFKTPMSVFQAAPGPWEALLVWVVGGLVALVGAFCFAELSSAYPRSGGEYVYLSESFGSLVGYLYAWAQIAVIRPASIGAVAFIFAENIRDYLPWHPVLLASLPIILLTLTNLAGVTLGKQTQNLLTVAKVLGLAIIVLVGAILAHNKPRLLYIGEANDAWFASSMILVLWTYAGWHEAAYIASEVRNPRRNLPLALILGTLGVAAIYLLVNLALLWGLGFTGARQQDTADLAQLAFGKRGAAIMHALITVSALGALNGMIFTTARIFSVFGSDHRLFTPLSHWSRRLGTPARALVVEGLISLALIGVVYLRGTERQGLEYLIDVSAAAFWSFFLLTGFSLFLLRRQDPHRDRPFSVPGYPLVPILFCLSCAYMIYKSIEYKREESLIGLGVLAVGLPFYFWPQKHRPPSLASPSEPEPSAMGKE